MHKGCFGRVERRYHTGESDVTRTSHECPTTFLANKYRSNDITCGPIRVPVLKLYSNLFMYVYIFYQIVVCQYHRTRTVCYQYVVLVLALPTATEVPGVHAKLEYCTIEPRIVHTLLEANEKPN